MTTWMPSTSQSKHAESKTVPLSSITPYTNNSRTHPEHQIKALVASISQFGFTQPLVVDEKHTILAGHGRYEAAKRLKLDAVPCRIVNGLSHDEKRAYVIADNKIAEHSTWDTSILLNELDAIQELDLGFDLNSLLDQNTFTQTKVEQVPITKLQQHPKNYKTHPKAQIDHLKQSIADHGIYRNIIITDNGTILAGHGVYQASVALGLTSLPCLRVNLDPFSAKALKLLTADNEIAHIADSNARDLTDILQQILVEDDLLGTGYDKEKLEALLMVSRSKDELKNLDDEEWDDSFEFNALNDAIKCIVSFENEKDRADFFRTLKIEHTDKTKNIWWPVKAREVSIGKTYVPADD